MAQIKPFAAWKPKPELARQVASKPYDVLSVAEAVGEAKDNPYSFLHVTRAEIDLPPETSPFGAAVYGKARANLERFINESTLVADEKPGYYIYQLDMPARPSEGQPARTQTGLVALSSIDDYLNDVIKKHELTRPDKEKDRIDHMLATKAQTGNVFMAYRDVTEINALISGWKAANKPVYDFNANDGIRHQVWVIDREIVVNSITELFSTRVANTYIADGHHRAASAAKVSRAMAGNPKAKYFLTTIFPASQLNILDYNRVVKDLDGMDSEDLISSLMDDFMITQSEEPVKPTQAHEFGMYLDRQWYILRSRKGTFSTSPTGVLDVTILSNNILNKILDVRDQRTDKRIDFVGGIRGLGELEKRVNSGEMKVAFSLYPVTIQQLFDIADSGRTMPPKSTWFEPKLRDGLFIHMLD